MKTLTSEMFWKKLIGEFNLGTSFFLNLIESMACGVFIVDLNGTVTYWNKAAERITGYPREKIIGKPCGQLPGERCKEGDCGDGIRDCGLFSSQEQIERECCLISQDGRELRLMKSARVVRDHNGRPFMGIVNLVDITSAWEAYREISFLKSQIKPKKKLGEMVGDSSAMHKVFTDIQLAAQSDASVLITGESGTGKELAARAIHKLGKRRHRPMITVNCCALPDTLIESELFGHMKGAFTGAVKDQIGRFEAADGGTLFIDEIGELPINVQVKLLRFLQFRTIERIGENCERKLDIRIIAATNHDLEVNTQKGLFREDLYYRINVFPIKMPPLRHHLEDIPLLSQYFLQHFSDSDQPKKTLLSDQAMKLLCNYKWPGNVRELENAIEYALVRVPNGGEIGIADLPSSVRKVFLESSYNLDQSDNSKNGEAQKILSALNANSWHRENTAKSLGISRITLWKRMKKHGLTQ